MTTSIIVLSVDLISLEKIKVKTCKLIKRMLKTKKMLRYDTILVHFILVEPYCTYMTQTIAWPWLNLTYIAMQTHQGNMMFWDMAHIFDIQNYDLKLPMKEGIKALISTCHLITKIFMSSWTSENVFSAFEWKNCFVIPNYRDCPLGISCAHLFPSNKGCKNSIIVGLALTW